MRLLQDQIRMAHIGKDFLPFQTMTLCISKLYACYNIWSPYIVDSDMDLDLSKHHCIVHYINSTD